MRCEGKRLILLAFVLAAVPCNLARGDVTGTIAQEAPNPLPTSELTSAADPDSSALLVGRWDSVERSRGGIGSMMEFKADGSVAQSVGAMVDCDFDLDGDQVLLTCLEPEGDRESSQKFRIEGDSLVLEAASGSELRFVRVGEPTAGDVAVVGEWKLDPDRRPPSTLSPEQQKTADLVAANTRWVFTQGGRALMRIPFKTETGTYAVDGDRLTLEFGPQTLLATFRLEGGSLFIAAAGSNREQEFRRPGD